MARIKVNKNIILVACFFVSYSKLLHLYKAFVLGCPPYCASNYLRNATKVVLTIAKIMP